jgi:hypothetical protein
LPARSSRTKCPDPRGVAVCVLILRLERLYGFGCADFGPGRCFNTDRGFLLHESIIRTPPTNVNRKALAIRTGGTYNRDMPKKKLPPEIREFFVRMGKKGGSKGGHARAANMTEEERSESARNAVTVRWKKAKEASHTSR